MRSCSRIVGRTRARCQERSSTRSGSPNLTAATRDRSSTRPNHQDAAATWSPDGTQVALWSSNFDSARALKRAQSRIGGGQRGWQRTQGDRAIPGSPGGVAADPVEPGRDAARFPDAGTGRATSISRHWMSSDSRSRGSRSSTPTEPERARCWSARGSTAWTGRPTGGPSSWVGSRTRSVAKRTRTERRPRSNGWRSRTARGRSSPSSLRGRRRRPCRSHPTAARSRSFSAKLH